MALRFVDKWIVAFRNASLKRKMIGMLIAIVVQSLIAAGLVTWFGGVYLRSVNATMEDFHHINRLLNAYTLETGAFDAYVLYHDSASEGVWQQSKRETDAALKDTRVSYAQSKDQFALLSAAHTSLRSYRNGCSQTLSLIGAHQVYAATYSRAMRIGEYLKGYLQTLLYSAISDGQAVYRRDRALIERIPLLFVVGIILVILGMAFWTRWMLRHVIAPIQDLTIATGQMSKNQYDAPDINVYQEDELAQLARTFNKMKHSTQALVESLSERSNMEARLHEEAVQRMQTEVAMDSLRLSLLQSQINPHFLFNTLNIISRMAQIENAPTTEELITRLSNLFRYNLQSVEDVVPLSAELRIAKDYMAIQEIRFGERMQFEINVEVNANHVKVPIFTLQPLIENAVIHGVAPLEEGGLVRVSVAHENQRLMIRVVDTGMGIAPERMKALMDGAFDPGRHVTGLGLGNVRARIEAYRMGSQFSIQSLPEGGTTVIIEIPLTQEETAHV